MDFYAKALNAYMLRTGATQEEIAEQIGVDRSNVSRWLDTVKPTRISKTYHAAIERLTGCKPGIQCPLESSCPIWTAPRLNHTAAAVIQCLNTMTASQQRRLLSAAEKILSDK